MIRSDHPGLGERHPMKKLLLLSLLLFLVSCSSEGPMIPTFTEIPEATSTPDATSTPVASETPLPSPTPTSEPDFSRVTSECLELLDHVPDDVNLPGALVFTEYLLNLETGEEIQLWEDYKFPKVSTDRDKMAVSLQKNQIQFFNGAGNQLTSVYIPGEDWLLPAYWINSNSIVLFKDYPIGGSGWGAYSDYSAILNIDTSDFIEIPKETYPDFHPHAMGNYWNSTKSVIGPNGRYVVYATSYSDIPPYDFMVLWDLEKNTEVARFDGLPYSTTPQWAPDGEYFLTTMNWEPFVTEEDLPYVV